MALESVLTSNGASRDFERREAVESLPAGLRFQPEPSGWMLVLAHGSMVAPPDVHPVD